MFPNFQNRVNMPKSKSDSCKRQSDLILRIVAVKVRTFWDLTVEKLNLIVAKLPK